MRYRPLLFWLLGLVPVAVVTMAVTMSEADTIDKCQDGITKQVGGVAFFDPGRSDRGNLSDAAHRRLREAANAAKPCPKSRLRVDGFADSNGNKADNQRLSQDRAETVADLLKLYLRQAGVDPNTIDVVPKGNGEQPGTAFENRRVEVKIEPTTATLNYFASKLFPSGLGVMAFGIFVGWISRNSRQDE